MKFRLDQNNFNACPQYNEWIDMRYGEESKPLDISGFQPRPSFVLFSLSQDTYQAAFADFQQQFQEELKQVIFDKFPTPISYYFYRFENGYENDLQRLYFLRDTWEAIIDILHAVAVAECRFRRISLADPIAFSHFLSDKVAQRLLNIEHIINHADSQNIPLDVSQLIPIATLQLMRELNQTRNAFSHLSTQSELQAQKWIHECYEDVIDILDDLQNIKNIEILRYLGQVDVTTLRCEAFRGHSLTRTIHNIKLTVDQIRNSQQYFRQGQIIVYYNGCLFGLQPLIHYREDSSGHITKLCMFRKTHGKEPNRYIDYEVVSEGVRWEQERILFKLELDEIRALFGLGPD
ncbi:MAG: hypothetical protein EHM45_06385 [Desulfobacteraceae bacterium]|nr:MAG: hypothetical protein EHM45_06385 [Desulfobacteraceae bacterium]